jgi:hypothetical protein
MFSRIVVLVALCAVVGCVSSEADAVHAADGGACACGAELERVTVANCAPQADGSCADAGVHEGTLADVLTYVCNYTDSDAGEIKPDITCENDTLSVSCRGATLRFAIVAGADGECRAEPRE